MAIYRIGKIISMMRDALGITQEELVEIYDGSETEDEKERKKVHLWEEGRLRLLSVSAFLPLLL